MPSKGGGLGVKPWRVFQILAFFLLVGALAGGCGQEGKEEDKEHKGSIRESNELVQFFIRENPGKEVITFALNDLNDDGREDLVVIYRIGKEKNMMRVVLDLNGKYVETNEVPAPYSDQLITFRDIDRKPPMEFIVQGMKGAKTGFAVFRVEGGKLVDLFGEGMDGCC